MGPSRPESQMKSDGIGRISYHGPAGFPTLALAGFGCSSGRAVAPGRADLELVVRWLLAEGGGRADWTRGGWPFAEGGAHPGAPIGPVVRWPFAEGGAHPGRADWTRGEVAPSRGWGSLGRADSELVVRWLLAEGGARPGAPIRNAW